MNVLLIKLIKRILDILNPFVLGAITPLALLKSDRSGVVLFEVAPIMTISRAITASRVRFVR
jgi:hypothetical protein